MYPFALEKQYKKFFVREFEKLAKPFTREVIARLKSEIRADSDTSIRADSATEMLTFIRGLRAEYGDKIETEKLKAIVKKNSTLLDAWSRDMTNDMLGKMYSRLNTPQSPSVTGRPTPSGKSGELWMTTVNPRNNLNENLIDQFVKRNVSLINDAYKSHFNDIERVVKEGLFSGKGHKAIARELTDATGVHISKTSFWARDQASKFFGETTRIRQEGAGIKGYIWKSVGDNKTRDMHLALEGTYHDWGNPPVVNDKGKRAHPGEDYNCRCWAEPALGPESAEKEYKGPIDDNYFENIRPGKEPGAEPAQWGKSGSIEERMVIDIQDASLKQSVGNMVNELNKVLGIDPKRIDKALTVAERRGLVDNANGAYSHKSKVIMIDPKAPFPESTFIHEYMHYLDANLLKDDKTKKELLNAIKESSANTKIQDALKILNKALKIKNLTKNDIDDYLYAIRHLKYLEDDSELFARAFEQYLIEYKSSDEELKKKMLAKKENSEFGYWAGDDAKKAKIHSFFNNLLKKEGLLK